jgi:hypothetical protein
MGHQVGETISLRTAHDEESLEIVKIEQHLELSACAANCRTTSQRTESADKSQETHPSNQPNSTQI